MNIDYTKGQNQYDLSRSTFGGAFTPVRGATAGTTLGKVLQAYFSAKGMDKGESAMADAERAYTERGKADMARMLGAYKGYSPREQAMSGGNMVSDQNKQALVESMMGANDPKLRNAGINALIGANRSNKIPSSIQEYEYAQRLSPEERQDFMDVKRAPGAKVIKLGNKIKVIDGRNNVLGEYDIAVSTDKTPENISAQTAAAVGTKNQHERWSVQMDEGLQAADGIPILTRSMSLLKGGVETGGWDNLKLKASNLFGVTGADEAELSANLGRAVLSQLRATFGAAFTEREGDRLAFIEANFGKSTHGNIRLLEQLEKMARREAERGIKAAESAGDTAMADQIREALDFSLDDDSPDSDQPPKAGETVNWNDL